MVIVQFVIDKKSMTVSNNFIAAEGLLEFFKKLGKIGLNVSKKMTKNVLRKPGTSLGYYSKHC